MSHKLVTAEAKLKLRKDRQPKNEPWTWNLEPNASLLAELKAYIESSAQNLQHKNYQLISVNLLTKVPARVQREKPKRK